MTDVRSALGKLILKVETDPTMNWHSFLDSYALITGMKISPVYIFNLLIKIAYVWLRNHKSFNFIDANDMIFSKVSWTPCCVRCVTRKLPCWKSTSLCPWYSLRTGTRSWSSWPSTEWPPSATISFPTIWGPDQSQRLRTNMRLLRTGPMVAAR